MTTQHYILIGFTSLLLFAATLLTVVQVLQFWDQFLARQFHDPVQRYQQLRMQESALQEGLRWWSLLLSGGTLVLVAWFHAYPLAITYFVLLAMVPRYVMEHLIRRREELLESQLIASASGLANAIKAGLSIPQGLRSVADETPAPLNKELLHVVYQFEHGRPLAETLADTRTRLNLEPFTLFCLALEVAVDRGGRVNVAMERLSSSLREWFRLRRKLASDTSAGRYAVLIMAMCPAGFILLFWFSGQESVLDLFTKFGGQIVLSIIIGLICIGVRMANRIMDIKLS